MNSTYYSVNAELEAVKGMAFLLLMSGEVESISGPLASALFDVVGDMTESEAQKAIAEFEATK